MTEWVFQISALWLAALSPWPRALCVGSEGAAMSQYHIKQLSDTPAFGRHAAILSITSGQVCSLSVPRVINASVGLLLNCTACSSAASGTLIRRQHGCNSGAISVQSLFGNLWISDLRGMWQSCMTFLKCYKPSLQCKAFYALLLKLPVNHCFKVYL